MRVLTFVVVALTTKFTSSVLHGEPADIPYNSSNLWQDCWQMQTDVGDLERVSENMGSCLKHRMYQGLIETAEQECVDFGDGVTFQAQGDFVPSPRDLFPLGEEPTSFRGLSDAYLNFLSRRGVRWDLGHLYPGLVMKISPTISADGVLEFVMERQLNYVDRTRLGSGQQLFRNTILPRLLGFRMNLMSLLPLVFGVLIYVAKNAVIFSKLTLIISTLLALKSLFVLQHLRPPQVSHDIVDSSVGASEAVSFIGGPRPHPHSLRPDLVLQMFAGSMPPFRGVNDKPEDQRFPGVRNFAWERNE